MSVQVTLKVKIQEKHLRHLYSAMAKVFGENNVEVLPGLLGRSQERKAAIQRALRGNGLQARTWRGEVRRALLRVPRGTNGVSPYGDTFVFVEGNPDNPVIRISYDNHGGLGEKQIAQVIQEYTRAVVLETTRAHGGQFLREIQREDGARVIEIHID